MLSKVGGKAREQDNGEENSDAASSEASANAARNVDLDLMGAGADGSRATRALGTGTILPLFKRSEPSGPANGSGSDVELGPLGRLN